MWADQPSCSELYLVVIELSFQYLAPILESHHLLSSGVGFDYVYLSEIDPCPLTSKSNHRIPDFAQYFHVSLLI